MMGGFGFLCYWKSGCICIICICMDDVIVVYEGEIDDLCVWLAVISLGGVSGIV